MKESPTLISDFVLFIPFTIHSGCGYFAPYLLIFRGLWGEKRSKFVMKRPINKINKWSREIGNKNPTLAIKWNLNFHNIVSQDCCSPPSIIHWNSPFWEGVAQGSTIGSYRSAIFLFSKQHFSSLIYFNVIKAGHRQLLLWKLPLLRVIPFCRGGVRRGTTKQCLIESWILCCCCLAFRRKDSLPNSGLLLLRCVVPRLFA